MRRICCFCEIWGTGGIESFISNVLLHLPPGEIEVDIAAVCMRESVFTAALRERGVCFLELSGKLRSPGSFRAFRQLLRERKYDAVHFHLFQGLSLYYVRIAREEGVPVRIAHSHNSDLRKSPGRRLKLMLHGLGRACFTGDATELWACSGLASAFLFGRRPFTFIPNGIDTERFRFDPQLRASVRDQLGVGGGVLIGSVGRLCYQKNQEFLLDVFAAVQTIRQDSFLLLVGDGEDETALREKAQRLGIAHRVIFYGVTSQVERLMWAMDVLAFPSRLEGLGIVAVEAQAAGLPVVVSEHVPEEAAVTPLLRQCPLGDAARWAEELLQAASAVREDGCDAVRRRGFDIADVAAGIARSYGLPERPAEGGYHGYAGNAPAERHHTGL